MSNDAQKNLQDLIADWEGKQSMNLNNLLSAGCYANAYSQYQVISHPQLKAASLLNGLRSIFGMLSSKDDARPNVERLLTLARKVDIARADDRVDGDHWKSLRVELDEMAAWYGEHKDKEYLDRADVRPYNEREKYITYMLEAFADNERFIVAKLSYGGSE